MSSLEYWKNEFKKITNTDAVTNTDKVLGVQDKGQAGDRINFARAEPEQIIVKILNAMRSSPFFKIKDLFYNINVQAVGNTYGNIIKGKNIDINGTKMNIKIILSGLSGNIRISTTPSPIEPNTGTDDEYSWFWKYQNINKSGEMGLFMMSIYINDPVSYEETLKGVKGYDKIFMEYMGY